MSSDKKFRYNDGRKARIGVIQKAKGKLALCKNGMHASTDILDALEYAPGSILTKVEMIGEVIVGDDKIVARGRKILWVINAEKILREFVCRCAERALKNAKVTDERCWNAIKAARLYIEGKITKEELKNARIAAYADAAVYAAAVYAAAAYVYAAAAYVAAYAAAYVAAYAAYAAAERKWQREMLLKMIEQKKKRQLK